MTKREEKNKDTSESIMMLEGRSYSQMNEVMNVNENIRNERGLREAGAGASNARIMGSGYP